MVNLDNILKQARNNATQILSRCPTSSLLNNLYFSPDERKIIFDAIRKLRDYNSRLFRLIQVSIKKPELYDYDKISEVLEYVRTGISALVASVEPYLHEAGKQQRRAG